MKRIRSERSLLRWLPSLLWAGLIFYLSSQPHISLPGKEFLLKDKIVHGVAFTILCALVFYGCKGLSNIDSARGLGLLGVITYGFLDEIHQKYVPGRLCDQYDFLADSVGAVVFFALFYLYIDLKRRRKDEVQVT
ncbi:MAG: VanZ family protein [Candidatus Glassbacteria bacterium]